MNDSLQHLKDEFPTLSFQPSQPQEEQTLWHGPSIPHTSTQLTDWRQLQTFVRTLQRLGLPLYTSPGPTPTQSGIIAHFRSSVELPPMKIDEHSMLITCDARHPIEQVESYARIAGYSVGFRSGFQLTLEQWIAQGFHLATRVNTGTPGKLIFSLHAYLPDGSPVEFGRAPRSSAGPSLHTLFWGTGGAFGRVHKVTLRLQKHTPFPENWKVTLDSWDTLSAMLCRFAQQQQLPLDLCATPNPSGSIDLIIQNNPKYTPFVNEQIQPFHPTEEEHPLFPTSPSHPCWLAISAWWDLLPSIPKLVQSSSPWPIEKLSLVHMQHESATLLFQFSPCTSPEQQTEPLLALIEQCKQTGVTAWGDPRTLPSKRLDPSNTHILRRIKAQIDPKHVLNPHILEGA